AYDELRKCYNQTPTPSDTNIFLENFQEKELRDWIAQARAHFVPIPPIPNPTSGVVTAPEFAGSLGKTIHDLQLVATQQNVTLPADYSFSFLAERNLVTFSPGSLNALASHLGEVKAICDILFSTKINGIDSIQREVLSDNDAAGPQSDYLTEKTTTTDLGSITPYAITFRCFSGDLGDVLSKLASSNHGFRVTGINVMPANGVAIAGGIYNGQDNANPPSPGDGLQTVLDEQMLSVSLGLEVVKLNKQ
ncbi:MAG: hypothetical protein ACREE6_04305, partial [Limisphaerales bacterium]